MGLTGSSVGVHCAESISPPVNFDAEEIVVALAGNPNVGKSTVFNGLTGMNQHTGNWSGKTVSSAYGRCRSEDTRFVMVDIPGTYSLMAHSAEEEVARDFICFGSPDITVVVCDATCLERNLGLVLQVAEVTDNVIVCVNLMDEAKRKGIHVNINELSKKLGVAVVPCVARNKKNLSSLLNVMDRLAHGRNKNKIVPVYYSETIEKAVAQIENAIGDCKIGVKTRFASLRLLEGDEALTAEIYRLLELAGADMDKIRAVSQSVKEELARLYPDDGLRDSVVSSINGRAAEICSSAVTYTKKNYDSSDRKIDRVLTGRVSGYAIMLLMLTAVFWLTIVGANYPSDCLSKLFMSFQGVLSGFFEKIGAPGWLHGVIVLGAYRVLSWVVAVMLPPMAIFFPLFTLLEDVGYLPRIAYNLDKPFKKCHACGKQALCMAMGFGCNAAGVVGCRIIDSPRERLLAILTNNFVPCNGRFPTLIAVITMFFVVSESASAMTSVLSAVILMLFVVLGVLVTFGVTRLLSSTLLRGIPSSFTLELPPYRRPQIGRVIVHSVFDRTLFVLGRAAAVAAPAGIIIWLMANITIGNASILSHCAEFLDPLGRLMGLDGVILIAFILGFPANEIVLPIILMAYTAQGSLAEIGSLVSLRELFVSHGWTWLTAVCVMLFSLMHFPCSTTLLTVKRETGSLKWTALAALIPTAVGMIICILLASFARLLGLV